MERVLIFKETLLPVSETFILAQAASLKRYQAFFCGFERCEPSLPIQQPEVLLTRKPGRIAVLRAKVYRHSGIAPAFHRAASRMRPRLIHAHFANGGCSALPLSEHLRVPLIVTLHGADVTVPPPRLSHYLELSRKASRFLCVSSFIRERAIKLGFPADKLQVHYIGVDTKQFTPVDRHLSAKRVLFVGRLVEKKGCEYLLRAMQTVQEQLPDCTLDIIGDGPLRAGLQELAAALRVRCTFHGSVPGLRVREALHGTTLLCAPSITAGNGDSEGLPIAIAEAQAAGVPVVSTLHAGIPEVVSHGVTGLLVPERDAAALADALLTLLRDVSLLANCRCAAAIRTRSLFDLDTQTGLLEDIYDEV